MPISNDKIKTNKKIELSQEKKFIAFYFVVLDVKLFQLDL